MTFFNRLRKHFPIEFVIVLCIAGAAIAAEKDAQKMGHDKPMPGELCVTCHMESKDSTSETPKINNRHEVCNTCHKGDGKVEGHCGCEEADDPKDCEQCHTSPATGTIPSAETMNDLCMKCH